MTKDEHETEIRGLFSSLNNLFEHFIFKKQNEFVVVAFNSRFSNTVLFFTVSV